MPVNSTDTVRLTLSVRGSRILATVASGAGVTEVGSSALQVPTDLTQADDVQAKVDVVGDGKGPLVWRLTSPDRTSLITSQADELNTGQPRHYLDRTFQWSVLGLASGENTQNVRVSILAVIGGVEHSLGSQTTDEPPPVVVVTPSARTTVLPKVRVPVGAFFSFVGLLGLLGSLWGALTGGATAVNAALAPFLTLGSNLAKVIDLVRTGREHLPGAHRDGQGKLTTQSAKTHDPPASPTARHDTTSTVSLENSTSDVQHTAAPSVNPRPDSDAKRERNTRAGSRRRNAANRGPQRRMPGA